VLLDFAVEGAAADAELLGHEGEITRVLLYGGGNGGALEFFKKTPSPLPLQGESGMF
jgi:hypothetical protein